jgi:molybdopterin converting factor small subunit
VSITVLVPGALRTEVAGERELTVSAAGTLGAVLDEVDRRWPRLGRRLRDEQGRLRRYVNVYVDGEDCRALSGLATPVADGAEVQVLPSIAGGADVTVEQANDLLAAAFAQIDMPADGTLVARATTVYVLPLPLLCVDHELRVLLCGVSQHPKFMINEGNEGEVS